MLSVIVPTYNRTECLYNMLKSLNTQTFTDYEVLVIDQSDDVSPEKVKTILSACRHIHYYNIDKKGRSMAKNFAIGKAAGEVLLFCDDDIVADENFLWVHQQLHNDHPEVGGLSCHLIEEHEKEAAIGVPLKITAYGRFLNQPFSLYEGYVSSLNGGNMSFKKTALQAVGFFDERLAGTSMLEEPDIAYRLMQCGYRLYFSAQTKVKHYPQHNGNIQTMQKQRYAWLRHYFFNQYYFMLRNRRKRFFPLLLSYLSYRTAVEMRQRKTLSPRFAALPFTTAVQALRTWRQLRQAFASSNYWFTPPVAEPAILSYQTNEHE